MKPEDVGRWYDTPYDGPVTVDSLRFGGRTVRLVRPAEPDRLLDDPTVLAWNRRDDFMPYWAYLWPGAYLLAEAVAGWPWRDDTPALEIGCGLGLAGLVGLASGLKVCFSDYDKAPLRFLVQSVYNNPFDPSRFTTRLLDWRDLPAGERFPVILGADVLYERRLVPLVANLIDRMLTADGFALVAGPYRAATEDLEAHLSAHRLRAEARPIAARTEAGVPVRGTLHRIGRSASR